MWRYAWASVPGTSHLRNGTACQDHAEVAPLPDGLIAVAADGAGSATHATAGARAACAAFLDFSRMALGWIGPDHLSADFARDALADLRAEIDRIAAASGAPASAYACTLLGALVTAEGALFVQLGDGAIVFRTTADGPWRVAAQSQRGEHANETLFVTRGDAAQHIQAVRIAEPVHEFALLTDGVEFLSIKQPQAEPHPAFFEHVMAGLRDAPDPGQSRVHSEWINRFLHSDAVNRRTDDDKTLILATRSCRKSR